MFTKITLPNQLRLITVPMGGVSTVTILVMVNTGANNETKEVNGISHFLEHMFFKGTKRRPSAKMIAEELDRLGASQNAFTSHEYTGYWIKVRDGELAAALDTVGDTPPKSILDPAEVERERGVILQEYRMNHDDPQRLVGYHFEALLYGDQPAGWEVAGTPETISRLTADELRGYFSRQYTIANTFVVVAGNFGDEAHLAEAVSNAFGSMRSGHPRARPPVIESQHAPALRIQSKETEQTHVILGSRAFGAREERKRFPAGVLAHLLGGSMASRLWEEIREKRGLAYAIGTWFDDYTTYGYLASYAGVAHENLERTIPLILDEYLKIREDGLMADELSRAKESLKGRLAISLESSDALAFYVGGEEVHTGKPMTPEEYFAKIDEVSPEDIQAVASEILRQERLNLAIVGPIRDQERFQKVLDSFR